MATPTARELSSSHLLQHLHRVNIIGRVCVCVYMYVTLCVCVCVCVCVCRYRKIAGDRCVRGLDAYLFPTRHPCVTGELYFNPPLEKW